MLVTLIGVSLSCPQEQTMRTMINGGIGEEDQYRRHTGGQSRSQLASLRANEPVRPKHTLTVTNIYHLFSIKHRPQTTDRYL